MASLDAQLDQKASQFHQLLLFLASVQTISDLVFSLLAARSCLILALRYERFKAQSGPSNCRNSSLDGQKPIRTGIALQVSGAQRYREGCPSRKQSHQAPRSSKLSQSTIGTP